MSIDMVNRTLGGAISVEGEVAFLLMLLARRVIETLKSVSMAHGGSTPPLHIKFTS
jgi:hypothetical protein